MTDSLNLPFKITPRDREVEGMSPALGSLAAAWRAGCKAVWEVLIYPKECHKAASVHTEIAYQFERGVER